MLIFNNFNPSFGRKRYKFIFKTLNNFEKKICGKIIEFNDTHIKFNNNNNNAIFLLDHLKYNEINFIDEYAINNSYNSYNSYNSSNQSEEEKDADEDEDDEEEEEEDDAYEDAEDAEDNEDSVS